MGVPAFFRWLSRKFPSIVVHCVEEKQKIVDGVSVPNDTSKTNPNGVEFDNLYLDMNGIIHPCCHPENKAAPKDEDEMMVAIFEYIDRLFNIIRPRRLLYMAIDGVAPRAKMNQQRSRRFRASKETAEKIDAISEVRQRLRDEGVELPPEKAKEEHFDSNCITPGTPFMHRLSKCLQYYIHDRLNSDPGWKNIVVILSDANVPGEGEHKIMDYIRRQRASPDHDPNTSHCLCGADADLIMLGLATHEPNFTIIREEFKPNQPRPCEVCGQIGHEMKDCRGSARIKQGEFDELEKPMAAAETEFIFIRLNVLREYLEKELMMTGLPFPYDFERCVDDWVFMCFFVGNDFLPHLPSLEIREGAIDRLVRLYKAAVYKTGGYLTDSGLVNLSRVQLILTELGEAEDEIFKRRQQNELAFRAREKAKKRSMALSSVKPAWVPEGQFAPKPITSNPAPIQNAREESKDMRLLGMKNQEAADGLRAMLKRDQDPKESNEQPGNKRKREGSDEEEEEEPHDEVRLWEDGWKERYYSSKFEVSDENIEFRHRVAAAYTLGLCWVLRYYYQGCPSWKWFFPYHYAPFASDFINIGDVNTDFEKGTKPFNPVEQLMGVFPAASRSHVPEAMAELMIDPESPIIDFYPDDFKIDLNGKKFAWQGVALLPFVDEPRLLNSLTDAYKTLSAEERKRNVRGDDLIFVRKLHTGYNFLLTLYESGDFKREFDINTEYFKGLGGKILLSEDAVGPNETVHSPVAGLDSIPGNTVVCMRYRDPNFEEDFLFPAKRLKGAKEPQRVLKPGDLNARDNRNFRPQIGMGPPRQRAYLDNSGFRKLDRSMSAGNHPYRSVAPPSSYPSDRSHGSSYSRQYSRPDKNQQQWQSGGQQQHHRSRSGPNTSYGGGGYQQNSGYQQQQQFSSGYNPRQSFSQSQGGMSSWEQRGGYQSSGQGEPGQSSWSSGSEGATNYWTPSNQETLPRWRNDQQEGRNRDQGNYGPAKNVYQDQSGGFWK